LGFFIDFKSSDRFMALR